MAGQLRTRYADRIVLVAISLALVMCFGTTRVAGQTLDDWLTVSSVGEFVWSSDGAHIYYTSNAGASGTHEIFRADTDGSNATQLGRAPDGVRAEAQAQLFPSADGEWIYYVSERYFQGYHNIWRMSAQTGETEQLTFNDAMIETSPSVAPNGGTLAFFGRTGAGGRIYVKGLGQDTNWPLLFSRSSQDETAPSFSPDGQSIAFSSEGNIWIRGPGDSIATPVVNARVPGGARDWSWSPDGTRFVTTNAHSGFAQVAVVDIATGRLMPITYAPRVHGEPGWSPDGVWVAFTRADASGFSNHVVVARADGTGDAIQLTEGNGRRSQPQFSPDGRTVAWIESTDVRTADVWKASLEGRDAEAGSPQQVTRSMGQIDPTDLSEAEEHFYPGPDGLAIPTLVYKPKAFDPSASYPVIVRLHGHPGQWNHSFEMMRQYFVQNGFVVVAPNPRGSRGFGAGFHDLHIADYGGLEFGDVMGVIPFMASLGYVDMSRKATWGGSGGGYMSFVIATEAPDAFQAQVIRAPVSDWQLLAIDRYAASGRAWNAGRAPRRERSEFGGAYDEIPEEYERRSPLNFVERVETPQLLFQGLRDAAVPPRQSQVWVDRMQELGKGDLIDYVELPDEVHSLRRYKKTMRDMLVRMTEFFRMTLDAGQQP